MKKLLLAVLILGLSVEITFAGAPTRTHTYTTGDTIKASEVNTNETNLYNYLSAGVDTYSAGSINTDAIGTEAITTGKILDGTVLNADISSSANISDNKLAAISTAGKVDGAALTGLANIPSGAGQIPAANIGGVFLPSGAVFFMITGNCPTGTTDVTSTYSGRFLKVGTSQGTTAGPTLTGTTDSHTLTVAEIPSHSHEITAYQTSSAGGSDYLQNQTSGQTQNNLNTQNTGGGGGHTHTLSSATTLEPKSAECRLCVVN